jgi:L-lactate permease
MAQPRTENGKLVLDAEQARQGKELDVMRYVLHISLALAVIAGVVVYAIFF